jgi:hypothetical protein
MLSKSVSFILATYYYIYCAALTSHTTIYTSTRTNSTFGSMPRPTCPCTGPCSHNDPRQALGTNEAVINEDIEATLRVVANGSPSLAITNENNFATFARARRRGGVWYKEKGSNESSEILDLGDLHQTPRRAILQSLEVSTTKRKASQRELLSEINVQKEKTARLELVLEDTKK